MCRLGDQFPGAFSRALSARAPSGAEQLLDEHALNGEAFGKRQQNINNKKELVRKLREEGKVLRVLVKSSRLQIAWRRIVKLHAPRDRKGCCRTRAPQFFFDFFVRPQVLLVFVCCDERHCSIAKVTC